MTKERSVEVTTPSTAEVGEGVHQSATHGAKGGAARERLLDAALELFAERGFETTTTKLVAQRAGVPHGLIHYYFETKNNLLERLLVERSFFPELEARLASARESVSTDPRSALIEICVEFFAFHRRYQPLARIIYREAHLNQEVRAVMNQFQNRVIKLMAEFLDGAAQSGMPRALDSEMVAIALLCTIIVNAQFREVPEPRAFVERLVDVLLGGGMPDLELP